MPPQPDPPSASLTPSVRADSGALTLAQALLSEMLASGYGCTKDEEAAANVRPAPPRRLSCSARYLRVIHQPLTDDRKPRWRFWLAAVGRKGEERACIPRGGVLHDLSVDGNSLFRCPRSPHRLQQLNSYYSRPLLGARADKQLNFGVSICPPGPG
jgi:hypothetical protein